MDFSQANVRDVVKTFENINMENTSLCLSEKAPETLCIMNPLYFIASKKLQPAHGYEFLERGFCIDGRVLGASDFSYGKYRPPGGAEYVDIRVYSYYGGNADKQINALKDLLSRIPTAVDKIDISEMFDLGDYRIYGNNLAKVDIRNPQMDFSFKNRGAKTLIFSVGSPEKLFTVNIDMMRGFRELGFTFEGYVIEGLNAPMILMKSDLLDAVGILAEAPRSGITTTPDGRSISDDAINISWWSESKALEAIQGEVHHFRPVSYGQVASRTDSVDTMIDNRLSTLSKSVSALRWHGYPDDQILKIVKDREYEAWLDIHSEILKRAREHLNSALSGGNIRYAENQAKQLCGEFERLQDLMTSRGNPDKLDYGVLKELVSTVNELRRV